jgi:integrase
MSVFKSKKSAPYYWFGFQINGHRFHGSTRCTNRKEAEKIEALERERAKAQVKATKISAVSLAIDHVAARYWNETGQHHAEPDAVARNLARLVQYFGPATPLTDIDDAAVAKMVAWRRGHRIKGREDAPLITPATVNRSATKVLKRLFSFAKSERAVFDREPTWTRHWLKEPEERVRELHDEEGERIDAAMRDDYKPFFDFVRATGMRLAECVTLKWSEVNFGARQIVKTGKGGRRITFPITPTIREILFPLQGHHPEFVFTYVAFYGHRRRGIVRGQRYPVTRSGAKSRWQRMRAAAGVTDFRFHDFRHTFATELLRDSGNLKLVQKALNHADINSTLRYAHVLDEDVATAIEGAANHRENHRGNRRKAE